MRYSLRAEGVGKSFGRTEVLKSASVWAQPGQVTTLMGRNGSGKTTLLRIAAGVLRADQGLVTVRGIPYLRPTLARLATVGVMYLPQERLLVSGARVRDHVRAIESTFGGEGVDAALAECGVHDLLDHRVEALSGGERVKVSLALALARRPSVLIADEPLVGLSPGDQEAAGAALRRLAAAGTAVVTSGHDVRVLLDISDVLIWSVAGTTHHLGSRAQALEHEQFCREYLGPRFTGGGEPTRGRRRAPSV